MRVAPRFFSTRRSASKPSIESCHRSSDPDPGPRVPFLIQGRPRVLWHNSCVQQFSCGVIDIALAMSRRVFLTAVCAPPTASFFLNFYDVMLPDFRLTLCADVYVLYDYSNIPAPPLVVALPPVCFVCLAKLSSLKYSC